MARNEVVGKARYLTEVDPSGIDKGLDQTTRRIKDTGTQAERAFAQQSTGALSKFGTSLKGVDDRLMTMTARGGLSGAILGGVGLGAGLGVFNTVQNMVSGALAKVGEGITLASDKAESASKANVLFGDSYGIVEQASRSAASTVAMSSGAYLAAAGNVGNLVTNMGVAGKAAANMSVDLIQLAADMGSFNNASPEEVIEAIGSAFRGETEPIRAYGVMLSAAKVEAKALALGLKDGKKPLTDYAKAMATYQLILDQTGAAQGDLARTADGLANKQRLAAARQEEALTRLGDALLPLANELIPALADAGTAAVEVLTDLVGGVKGLWAIVGDVNEFFKPWEKEARLAKEEVGAWADELERMPEAAGKTRDALEGIASQAQAAGTGLAGAKEELIDLARWTAAIALSGNQLPGMLRNFKNWTDLLAAGTITTAQFDAKVRTMARAGLGELRDNLDLLPPALRDVVLAFDSGQDAVDTFVRQWRDASTEAVRSGDWERFSAFLVSNADLIREHFDQLPADVQKAMLASGIVARQQLGDWAGTIAQVYQGRLVNSMQGFWTGDGLRAIVPPPEVLKQVQETAETLGNVLDLGFAGARELGPPVKRGVDAAITAISNLGPGFRQQLERAATAAERGMDDVMDALKNPTKFRSTIRTIEDNIDKLNRMKARALREGRDVDAAIIQGGIDEQHRLWEGATGQAYQDGVRITKRHGKGIKDGDGKGGPTDESENVNQRVRNRLKRLTGLKEGGAALVQAWEAGIVAGLATAYANIVASKYLTSIAHIFGGSLPEEGPLVGSWHGGGDLVRAWFGEALGAAQQGRLQLAGAMAPVGAGLTGWAITASASQVVDHRISGSVAVDLDYGAMRAAGMSPEEMGRAARSAGEITLGDVLRTARATAGRGYLAPGRA